MATVTVPAQIFNQADSGRSCKFCGQSFHSPAFMAAHLIRHPIVDLANELAKEWFKP